MQMKSWSAEQAILLVHSCFACITSVNKLGSDLVQHCSDVFPMAKTNFEDSSSLICIIKYTALAMWIFCHFYICVYFCICVGWQHSCDFISAGKAVWTIHNL